MLTILENAKSLEQRSIKYQLPMDPRSKQSNMRLYSLISYKTTPDVEKGTLHYSTAMEHKKEPTKKGFKTKISTQKQLIDGSKTPVEKRYMLNDL